MKLIIGYNFEISVLESYVANIGIHLLTYRDSLSVTLPRVRSLTLERTGCLDMSVNDYQYPKRAKYSYTHAVAQLVEALRYKSEGRRFDSRCYHWNF